MSQRGVSPSRSPSSFRWKGALLVAGLVAAISSFIHLGMLRDPSFDPFETVASAPFLRAFIPRYAEIFFAFVLAEAFQHWRERRKERQAQSAVS